MNRRQFMAAAAAGFGTPLVSATPDALAQTAGHYLAEEAPQAVIEALERAFV